MPFTSTKSLFPWAAVETRANPVKCQSLSQLLRAVNIYHYKKQEQQQEQQQEQLKKVTEAGAATEILSFVSLFFDIIFPVIRLLVLDICSYRCSSRKLLLPDWIQRETLCSSTYKRTLVLFLFSSNFIYLSIYLIRFPFLANHLFATVDISQYFFFSLISNQFSSITVN